MKKTVFISVCFLPFYLLAVPLQGIEFTHEDWQTVCDNTGTCRVAGYQKENESFSRSVSLLFTREAGEYAPIIGKIHVGKPENDDGSGVADFYFAKDTRLMLNGKSLGRLKLQEGVADLTPTQTKALMGALKHASQIEVQSGKYRWRISDKGAAAALLKADDFQKRVNTPNAWIRQGNSRHVVLPPQKLPIVQAAKVSQQSGQTLTPKDENYARLMTLLRQSHAVGEDSSDYCYELHNTENPVDLTLYHLDKQHILAESICIRGAYQSMGYYAILDSQLKRAMAVLPLKYAGYDEQSGTLTGVFKARGLGDCWLGQEAVWNGRQFVKTREWTTGMCRGLLGGAWEMPIFTSRVIYQ